MTARPLIGWAGHDAHDITRARLYEMEPERPGSILARTLRPLPPGRTYQERCTYWVQHGAWQVRGLAIEAGWTLGRPA